MNSSRQLKQLIKKYGYQEIINDLECLKKSDIEIQEILKLEDQFDEFTSIKLCISDL